VLDAAGNTTLLSPHDPETGEWVFFSRRGEKVFKVKMEKLVRTLDELLGGGFIEEFEERREK